MSNSNNSARAAQGAGIAQASANITNNAEQAKQAETTQATEAKAEAAKVATKAKREAKAEAEKAERKAKAEAQAVAKEAAKQAAKAEKEAEQAKAKATKEAEKAAKEAEINAITEATKRVAAQAVSLSALVSAAILAAKEAGAQSATFSRVNYLLSKGGGALDLNAADEATKAERAAYIRALRAVWPCNIGSNMAEAHKCGIIIDETGIAKAVYSFAQIEKWSAAKVVRVPLLAILRNEGRTQVDAAKYYADKKGRTAFAHKATIERDMAKAAEVIANAKAKAEKRAAEIAEKAAAYDALKAAQKAAEQAEAAGAAEAAK